MMFVEFIDCDEEARNSHGGPCFNLISDKTEDNLLSNKKEKYLKFAT